MKVQPRSTAISTGQSGYPALLIGRARREESWNLGAAALLAAAGVGLGRDVAAPREVGLWLAVLSTSVWVMQVQWCLWSDALRRDLLPLPIAPGAHFRDAMGAALRRSWAAAMAPVGFAAGAGLAGQGNGEDAKVVLLLAATAWGVALPIAPFAAGIAGLGARRSRSRGLSSLQTWLSGGWAAPEHAAFFYTPSLALGAIASAVVSLGPRPALALVAWPCCAVGFFAFRRSIFEVVPRVREHEMLLRRPGEMDDAPATLAWGSALPIVPRALHALFVRQLARRTRGRGVLTTLGLAGLGLYLLRTDSPAPLVGAAAVVGVAALSRSALAAADEATLPAWMQRSLPIRRGQIGLAAALAALPEPAVAGTLAALALLLDGAFHGAAAVGLAVVVLPTVGAAAPRAPWIGAGVTLVLAALPLVGGEL